MIDELIMNRVYTQVNLGDRAAYSYSQAARYLDISPTTLSSWVRGRWLSTRKGKEVLQPLIDCPPGGLSFNNLVELHVLRALQVTHKVDSSKVRQAIRYTQEKLGIQRLLLRKQLLTAAGDLFIECYGNLISLTRVGQVALREVLHDHLHRVEWRSDLELPCCLYPFTREGSASGRVVAIDPSVAFGQPAVRGIRTGVIAARINLGETIEEVAGDYGMDPAAVTEAIIYELKIAA